MTFTGTMWKNSSRPVPKLRGRLIEHRQSAFQGIFYRRLIRRRCCSLETEIQMEIEFTAHNIRLDDGTFTKPDADASMEAYAPFVSARRVLETVLPGDKRHLHWRTWGVWREATPSNWRRLGLQVLGIEVRESNLAACNYVKSKTSLPNLEFVKDNASTSPRMASSTWSSAAGCFTTSIGPRDSWKRWRP